ncbi:hypothetical protein LX69_00572 [Breznakibacter xylanolyticus]|uniref:Uncharacterized protein n=1 Tax=Breznakibacter xylanolyticus TaxID=990 RepID=A0A2W7QE05_9BACT|nr:hypothetical protein [Breznakibacter xylanolyticus]PZX20119.1 hypothetical protein LX69_00572 [Breznakibacter xylanolyticus]
MDNFMNEISGMATESIIMSDFHKIVDTKKVNGMLSRTAMIESVGLLCLQRCIEIRQKQSAFFSEERVDYEISLVCKTIQKQFPFPNEIIGEWILPKVKEGLKRF